MSMTKLMTLREYIRMQMVRTAPYRRSERFGELLQMIIGWTTNGLITDTEAESLRTYLRAVYRELIELYTEEMESCFYEEP